MYIYLATSWSNPAFEYVHRVLSQMRDVEVYNFRDPASYFQWDQVAPNWEKWTVYDFNRLRDHPRMIEGFERDDYALERCDVLVLLLPCGNDAHLEAGKVLGQGKPVIFVALESKGFKPGLMYKLSDIALMDNVPDLVEMVRVVQRGTDQGFLIKKHLEAPTT